MLSLRFASRAFVTTISGINAQIPRTVMVADAVCGRPTSLSALHLYWPASPGFVWAMTSVPRPTMDNLGSDLQLQIFKLEIKQQDSDWIEVSSVQVESK